MLKTRIVLGTALGLFLPLAAQATRPDADIPGKPVKTEPKPPGDAEPLVRAAVRDLLTADDFAALWRLPAKWKSTLPEQTRRQLALALLERLRSARAMQLRNYADLFIPSRVQSGRMTFQGHGLMVAQDLFVEGGRCAWAAEELLGVRLPPFTEAVFRNPPELDDQVRESHRRVSAALIKK